MPKMVLVPHNMGSRSAKNLAATLSRKLGYKVWRVSPQRIRNRAPFVLHGGTDKTTQLKRFNAAGIPHPDFTENRAVAVEWLNDGDAVMCRTLLRASEGRGIVIAETVDQLVHAPLYTRYVKKKSEYRVHVLNGEVIDVQMKRKRRNFEDRRDTKVRNLANGYVFCRDNIVELAGLRDIAIQAVASLNYNLGAVDIAYNEKYDRLVVLEVNANPGMQGTTLENYANKIITQRGLK